MRRSKIDYANEDIYERIAVKLNLTVLQVREVIENGFFKQITNEIRSGCYNDILIPYLGKLKFNPKQFKKINYYNKIK